MSPALIAALPFLGALLLHLREPVRGLEAIAVAMIEWRLHRADDGPFDPPVLLEAGDDDAHLVLAHRKVVERLAIHVDHELITNRTHRRPLGALQHAGTVDGDMAVGRGQ